MSAAIKGLRQTQTAKFQYFPSEVKDIENLSGKKAKKVFHLSNVLLLRASVAHKIMHYPYKCVAEIAFCKLYLSFILLFKRPHNLTNLTNTMINVLKLGLSMKSHTSRSTQ